MDKVVPNWRIPTPAAFASMALWNRGWAMICQVNERLVGRWQSFLAWRTSCLQSDREMAKETAELPYNPIYCHQYWFIDIRYRPF
jgi:hypothetical protein